MRTVLRALAKGTAAFLLFWNLSCAAIAPQPGNPAGILYAIDEFNVAIYAFSSALTLNGSVAPTRTISGNVNALITRPTALAVDSIRDILYVADSSLQEILAFNPASTVNGDVAPLRRYPGPVLGGNMVYDEVNDRLFVTDETNQLILAWDQISTLPTGTVAGRSINLGFVPSGIFVDRQRDLLYVGDPAFQGVKVYDKPSTLSTNVVAPVKASFTDSTRPFQFVNGLTMNVPNDLLFVTESSNIFVDDNNPDNDFSPSVEMFDDISVLNQINVSLPADRSISGVNTGLSIDTRQPIFNVADSVATLWVIVNNTTINVWTNANQIGDPGAENLAPTRSIQVSTANARIIRFDVDLAH